MNKLLYELPKLRGIIVNLILSYLIVVSIEIIYLIKSFEPISFSFVCDSDLGRTYTLLDPILALKGIRLL